MPLGADEARRRPRSGLRKQVLINLCFGNSVKFTDEGRDP